MSILDYYQPSSLAHPSSRRMVVIVAVGAVAVAVALLIHPYTGAGLQQRNMAAAAQHLPAIQAVLNGNARYINVTAEVWTGTGGGVILRGAVNATNDLAQLKRDVQATSPPSSVTWAVTVDPPTTGPAN